MKKAKGKPDYYISPTLDFTQYIRDSEERHWDRVTAFEWDQDIRCNLRKRLDSLAPASFSRTADLANPILLEAVERRLTSVRRHHLPANEDALLDISESIPGHQTSIDKALKLQQPLKDIQADVARLFDQLGIVHQQIVDLDQLRRLHFYRNGLKVKPIETAAEHNDQASEATVLRDKYRALEAELIRSRRAAHRTLEEIKSGVEKELMRIEGEVLADLERSRELILRVSRTGTASLNSQDQEVLKSLLLKRQLRAMKDIANHALVVEQSAIAPLTMGVIHYRRHREIQQAMITFISDEAKHSATFRRFLVDKLSAKEFVSEILIRGASRYMWVARFLPGTGIFLAVIVEAIGAATLEFFAHEEYMPEDLFCSICKKISIQDEVRHLNICVGIYNELYRTGSRLEKVRNDFALKMLLKAVYGDKTDDHDLIQAFRVFGVSSEVLFRHVMTRLSEQLARTGTYVTPDQLLKWIGR